MPQYAYKNKRMERVECEQCTHNPHRQYAYNSCSKCLLTMTGPSPATKYAYNSCSKCICSVPHTLANGRIITYAYNSCSKFSLAVPPSGRPGCHQMTQYAYKNKRMEHIECESYFCAAYICGLTNGSNTLIIAAPDRVWRRP